MRHIARKACTVGLALLIACSLMAPSALVPVWRAGAAEGAPVSEDTTIDRQELSRSKTATPLDDNLETEVTISIPKKESADDNAYDVAFLVDSSSLMRESYGGVLNSMLKMVEGLREQGNKAKVNVCMIGFNNSAKVFFPMTPIDAITQDFMEAQKKRFENVKPFYNHYRNRDSSGPETYGDLVPWVAFGDAEKDYVLSSDIKEQTDTYTLYNFDARTSDTENADFFAKWPHNVPTVGWAPTGEGTNLQHGMHDAVELLDAAGANADCKYMVLITDGAAFYYDNEDGESSSTVGTTYGKELRNLGNLDVDVTLAPGNLAQLPLMAPELDESKDAYEEADPDKFWDYIRANGAAIEQSAAGVSFSKEFMSGKQELQGSSVNMKGDNDPVLDSTYSTTQSDKGRKGLVTDKDAYPYTNMERGVYYAAKEMIELRNRGYNFAMVGFKYGSDKPSDKPWLQRALAGAFVKWASKIGAYFHYPDDVEQHDATDISEQLLDMANRLFYPIKAGSTLIDEMGFDKTADTPGWWYDLVIPQDESKLADYFEVKADGEVLAVNSAQEGGKTVLTFTDSTSAAVCRLTYNPEGIEAHTDPYTSVTRDFTKCYKLDILKNLQTLTMKYHERLVLTDAFKAANAGKKVTTYANDDAVVEQGEEDPTEEFEQPPVEITIEEEETPLAGESDMPPSETQDTSGTDDPVVSGDDVDDEDDEEGIDVGDEDDEESVSVGDSDDADASAEIDDDTPTGSLTHMSVQDNGTSTGGKGPRTGDDATSALLGTGCVSLAAAFGALLAARRLRRAGR